MIYTTTQGYTYVPTGRSVINITYGGHYEILLEYGSKVTYVNKEAFELSLLNNTNCFYKETFSSKMSKVFKNSTDKITGGIL